MSRKRFSGSAIYTQLPSVYDTADGIEANQFEKPREKFPLRPAVFIFGFLMGGIICLTLGTIILFGFTEDKYEDRVWPLFILGAIMFIPGGYYSFIVICVLLDKYGYMVEDIPAF